MDRDIAKQRALGDPYYNLAQQLYQDDSYYVVRVRRLENGFTFNKEGWKAKYVPDIPAILREVALSIGGPEAVPVTPVSAEEAGLLNPDEPVFPEFIHPGEEEVHKIVEYFREKKLAIPGATPWWAQARIDTVFKLFGYADYHDYKTRKIGSDDEDAKILAVFRTLVNKPASDPEPVNEERKNTDG
jgi:hypothetical protein